MDERKERIMFNLIKVALGVAAVGMIITHREAIMERLKGASCGMGKAEA